MNLAEEVKWLEKELWFKEAVFIAEGDMYDLMLKFICKRQRRAHGTHSADQSSHTACPSLKNFVRKD
jgi:cytosine/adenosine deaminase-related metal-dependent hydrolase